MVGAQIVGHALSMTQSMIAGKSNQKYPELLEVTWTPALPECCWSGKGFRLRFCIHYLAPRGSQRLNRPEFVGDHQLK